MSSCHKSSVERILDRHVLGQVWKASAEAEVEAAQLALRLAREKKHHQSEANRSALDQQVLAKMQKCGSTLEQSKLYLQDVLARESSEAREEHLRRMAAKEKERRETEDYAQQHKAEVHLRVDKARIADRELRERMEQVAAAEASNNRKKPKNKSSTPCPETAMPLVGGIDRRCQSSLDGQASSSMSIGILPNLLDRLSVHRKGISVMPPADVIRRIRQQDVVVQSLPLFTAVFGRRPPDATVGTFGLPSQNDAVADEQWARAQQAQVHVRNMLESQMVIRHETEKRRREEERAFANSYVAEGLAVATAMDRMQHAADDAKKRRLKTMLEKQLRHTRIARKTYEVTPKI